MRMQPLLSALEGEANKFMESIGCEGIFFATVLKSLKRDFGNIFADVSTFAYGEVA